MTTFTERLDAAAGAATCQFLNQFGSAAVGYGAYALFAGGTGTVPMALGAAALLASNAACTWDPDAAPTVDVRGPAGELCWGTDGEFVVYQDVNGQQQSAPIGPATAITSSAYYDDVAGASRYEVGWTDTGGIPRTGLLIYGTDQNGNVYTARQEFLSGTCTTPGPGDTGQPTPTTYIDNTSGCELIVNWEGLVIDQSGTPQPVYRIEPGAQQLRAGGGIIGGCNFAPVLYVGGGGGGGGGGTYIPIPDDPQPGPGGQPWWLPLVEAALGGLIGAAAKKILDVLTEQQVAGKVYRLTSVCETNAAGEPVDLVREVDIPSLSILQAAIYRLDAIEYLLQGLKDFRQPTCRKTNAAGQLVSVDFASDEPSPGGTRPLRKLLRYRDQTNTPLADHVAHWDSFVWQAGPVIVVHRGGPWGILKVWALDADEGKRVIRHAGTIAGVDPDAEGEWLITASNDPRYGQTGTMRLARRSTWDGQILQISKRDGPNGLPTVPCDCG